MATEEKALYANLGLQCNPFRRSLAEAANPCKLIVAGSKHRKYLSRLVDAIANWKIPSYVFLIQGPWGVGKTTVAKRAICDAVEQLGELIDVHILISELSTPTYGALVIETIKSIICRIASLARSPSPQIKIKYEKIAKSIIQDIKEFPHIYEIVKALTRKENFTLKDLQDNCAMASSPHYIRIVREKQKDCKFIEEFIDSARHLLLYIASRAGVPIYIIYDQFERLLSIEANTCTEFNELFRFKAKFIKELIHNFSKKWNEGLRTKIVFSIALLDNYFANYIGQLTKQGIQSPTSLIPNYESIALEPFSSVEDTRALIEAYLKQSGCRIKGEGIAPFSDEAVAAIHNWSKGLPREIVKLSEQVINEAAERGMSSPIGADLVKQVALSTILGSVASPCVDKYDEILEKSGIIGENIHELIEKIIEVYNVAKSGLKPGTSEETIDVNVMPLRRSNRTYLVIYTNSNAVILGTAHKRITIKTIEGIKKLVEDAEKILGKKFAGQKAVLVTYGGEFSSTARRELLQKEIAVELVDLTRDVVARIGTACIIYYSENPVEAKKRLTPRLLIGLLDKAYNLGLEAEKVA